MPVWKGDLPGVNELFTSGGGGRTGCFFLVFWIIVAVIAVVFFPVFGNRDFSKERFVASGTKKVAEMKKSANELIQKVDVDETVQKVSKVATNLGKSGESLVENLSRPFQNEKLEGGKQKTAAPSIKKEPTSTVSIPAPVAQPQVRLAPFKIEKAVVSEKNSQDIASLQASFVFSKGTGPLYYVFKYSGYQKGEVIDLQLSMGSEKLYKKPFNLNQGTGTFVIELAKSFVPGRYTVNLYNREGQKGEYVFHVQDLFDGSKTVGKTRLPVENTQKPISVVSSTKNNTQGDSNKNTDPRKMKNRKFCFIHYSSGKVSKVEDIYWPAKTVAEQVLYHGYIKGEPYLGESWEDENNVLQVRTISNDRAKELLNGL